MCTPKFLHASQSSLYHARSRMAEAMDTQQSSVGSNESPGAARLANLPMADRPTCIICLGMAGSGKTTFVQVGIN